jgi:hypothetical protein
VIIIAANALRYILVAQFIGFDVNIGGQAKALDEHII